MLKNYSTIRSNLRFFKSSVASIAFNVSVVVVLSIVVVVLGRTDDTHNNNNNIILTEYFTHENINKMIHRRLDEVMETNEVDPNDLSVNVSFEDILKTVVFLLLTWMAANFCKLVGLPSLAGEIIAGVVLGPPVLDFCPYPEAMVLIGSFGLIGLILNSGIDLDIAQLRETGTRAVVIALSGTILALSSGIGVSYLLPTDYSIYSAFSIGAAFAPSSWGVGKLQFVSCTNSFRWILSNDVLFRVTPLASQVLSKGEVLNTPIGQTIMASSVVDDILGLVLLSLLQVFVMDEPSTFDFIKPFLASFGFLITLGGLGITMIPHVIQEFILPRFPEQQRDFVAIGLMFCLMTLYLPAMNYSGASYLTGAFLAGVSFSQLHHAHATFARSSHEIMVWLMRIFFAATIGFQVPASYFKESLVLRKGFVFRKWKYTCLSRSRKKKLNSFHIHLL
jgi:Kef-type K+ transport system membrane component KefB